ncbi:DNA polymerase delta catalytic subunit [Olea europaea subsp. europaea]|uniref:DNA polymerase delta catalytic subunit n=1 Tax=Olea europaea subsp. europaea TaxID=158383 RepID=A0A8S0RYD0_OLEEU|nr:DNA polymerase delta catalytic subunit [Olea europaea subsp. europaea]
MLILKELSNYLITIEHVVLMVLSWSSSSGGYGHNAGSAKVLFTRMCCALVEIAQYFIEGRMHRKTWLKPSFHWIDGTTDTLKVVLLYEIIDAYYIVPDIFECAC